MIGVAHVEPAPTVTMSLRRWLAPPLSAFVFLVHPLVALLRPARQLQDPGTGWHLATGRYILATHTIPHADVFSFTAAGQPWVSYYWLFDTVAAACERIGGLPLYGMACVLLFAALPVLLYRRMVRIGVGILPALLLTAVAYLVLMSHALARPHVVTYLLFAFFLERLDDVHAGRRPARSLWVLPPLAALWCNMHGGFLAGLALTAIFAAVAAGRALVTRDPRDRGEAATFAVLLVAMTVATALNPNGFGLHYDTLHHLSMSTTSAFDEFRSPDFRGGGWPVFWFEVLILATLAVAARGRRRLAPLELVLLCFFLHEALHAVRHMNLFAIVAAPIVARELSALVDARWPAFARRWRAVAREQAELRSPRLYLPAVAIVLVMLALAGRTGFPRTLDDLQLTRGAADFIAAHRERFARPFNTDNLGGSLIYRFWPDVRVFVDDRIPVYGDAFVRDEYLPVLAGDRRWRAVLDRHDVTAAVVTAGTPCATLLAAAPEWDLAFDDGRNAIFLRAEAPSR